MCRLGIDVASRASLAFYNTEAEIDTFIAALRRVREVFG
jgi:selenocysteine lyase/cysteine desulfurase